MQGQPMPQGQGAPAAQAGQDGPVDANSPTNLIIALDQGLTKLIALMKKAQVPPETVGHISQSLENLHAGIESMAPGTAKAAVPEAGVATMEQGASKGVVPA